MTKLQAHLFIIFSCCLASGYVFSATAASASGELTSLPWPQIFVGILLSLWGGLTRTSENALAARTAEVTTFMLGAEIQRDIIVSSGVGFVIYSIGSAQDIGVWTLGIALWLGGYSGTRFLRLIETQFLNKFRKN